MGYLQPSEYTMFGLAEETEDAWVLAASALMDSHCQRTSLNPTQYVERLRVVDGRPVRLTYLPLVVVAPATSSLVSVRARLAAPRRGEWAQSAGDEIAQAFSLPGSWTTLDAASVDCYAEIGEIAMGQHALGLTYNEVEVTYTAGLAVLPDAVKAACAQIIRNAQAMPAGNVQQTKLDTMQMAYFSDALVDEQVRTLLRPFVARKVG